jgi:hypothetical protein
MNTSETEESTFVVTLGHPRDDNNIDGLRRMSRSEAEKLVAQAAQWNHRSGRILPVDN